MGKSRLYSVALILKYVVKVACLLAAVYFIARCINSSKGDDEIVLKPTPIVIEDVRPIGELYTMTAITEDYDLYFMEDPSFSSIFRNDYVPAIQTLRMQLSFVMNLDSVRYEPMDGSDTVVVYLPPLRFVAAGNGGQLLGGVEKKYYNAVSDRIDIVEYKIKKTYNTRGNYNKAMESAKLTLDAFVRQCGRVPKFVEIK